MTYEFRRVVPGVKTYVLQLGHRTPTEYSESELREGIELTIGGKS